MFCISSISAQRRDFLTDEEIEIVRDAQDIDARIDVLVKMMDRRFGVLGINVNGWKIVSVVGRTAERRSLRAFERHKKDPPKGG